MRLCGETKRRVPYLPLEQGRTFEEDLALWRGPAYPRGMDDVTSKGDRPLPHRPRVHTHVKNTAARALYERHGFRAVRFGVSPPPESEPDVEYHCRPG